MQNISETLYMRAGVCVCVLFFSRTNISVNAIAIVVWQVKK